MILGADYVQFPVCSLDLYTFLFYFWKLIMHKGCEHANFAYFLKVYYSETLKLFYHYYHSITGNKYIAIFKDENTRVSWS